MNLITAVNPDIDTIGLLYDLSQDPPPSHCRCKGFLRCQRHQVH